MKYLILSDIHGNLEALKAVRKHSLPYDRVICLGDLVGYGASPNEVIRKVRKMKPVGIVRGNHDKVCSGQDSGHNFNNNAYLSALWTQQNLDEKSRSYLQTIPMGPVQIDKLITICHGSPMDEDHYILYQFDAQLCFQCFDTVLCFFGHSHVPGLFVLDTRPNHFFYFIPRDSTEFQLDLNGYRRYLINPGSVGQPRDSDPRASFAHLDTDTGLLSFFKIEYSIREAADKIRSAGLPVFLADRLFGGI
ncbi:MAG: metallophosphoesterase family protein [Acidobacteria bacterium]|nr:metallophosphoesterase family protein [Acidobacteriota bacterium]